MTEPDWSKVTCDVHRNEPQLSGIPNEWVTYPDRGGPYGYPFRQCSYCGSMHPEDFFNALKNGARPDMADWKYGWPHKFYVNGIVNPLAGQVVEVGSRSGSNGEREPIMGEAPAFTVAKFYNVHLRDIHDEAALAALIELVNSSNAYSRFGTDEKGLWFSGRNPVGV